MNDLPNGANGLQIIVHETEPKAIVHMFIDGQYTHWVEFDLLQMKGLIESLQRKIKQMAKNRDAMK